MAEDKPSRRPTKQLKARSPADDTVRPPFDPEAYARESESRLRVADVVPPPPRTPLPPGDDEVPPSSQSATRLTARPPHGDVPSPEAVPYRATAAEDLEWFDLDAEAIALFNRVNGVRTIARIADSIGIAEVLACAVFMRLASEKLVGFR
jgi:hypothetical protein